MIDRQKLETLLSRRFPESTSDQIAAAANAVMAMARGDEQDEGPRAGRRSPRPARRRRIPHGAASEEPPASAASECDRSFP